MRFFKAQRAKFKLFYDIYGYPSVLVHIFGASEVFRVILKLVNEALTFREFRESQRQNCSVVVLAVSNLMPTKAGIHQLTLWTGLGYNRCTSRRHFSFATKCQPSTLGGPCSVDYEPTICPLFGVLHI
jgi:hypothetical protein